MYLPPAASTVCWMFGLSAAAQRGCWKLFQDTPTVQLAAAALAAVLAPGAVVAVLLPQAATKIAVAPNRAAALRRFIRFSSNGDDNLSSARTVRRYRTR
jgi:hypothetical protein